MVPHIKAKRHEHLDGSDIMIELLPSFYAKRGVDFPFSSVDECREFLRKTYISIPERFAIIYAALQREQALYMAGYTYGKRRHEEGYLICEPKFAPQYHTRGGLSIEQVNMAICAGLRQATADFGIKLIPCVCIGREADINTGIEVAESAIKLLDNHEQVILDLVCDEPGNPPEKHFPAYQRTFGVEGLYRDCHAGEWVWQGFTYPKRNSSSFTSSNLQVNSLYRAALSKNIRTAIELLNCHSIGHAITLGTDRDLMQLVLERDIRIVGCPSSNLELGHIGDLHDLNIAYMLDRGIWYTIDDDDNWFLSKLEDVQRKCDDAYRFTAKQVILLEKNAMRNLGE